jgi:hypothetical protein
MSIIKISVIISCSLMLSSLEVRAQQIIFDTSKEDKVGGYHQVWDPSGRRLISYRDASDPALAAVQVSTTDGKKMSFYPIRDLGCSYIDIWSATGSPDGGVVIAALLGYGPRNNTPVPVKSVIVTYDSIGTIRSVWEVEPYHHHYVAADSNGNVYALGHTYPGMEDYSLLVKYSRSGNVVGEYLSSRLFSEGDKVIYVPADGEASVSVNNEYVSVWIAATQELFTLSLDGTLVSRISLASALTNMASSTGNARVNVAELRTDSARQVIAQVRLWPKDGSLAHIAVARIGANGAFENWVETPPGATHRFLGLTLDDRPVFLEKYGQATRVNLSQ